jgi:F-type H+-transporting ATPase subunit a
METHHGGWLNLLVEHEPQWLRPYLDLFVLHTLLAVVLLGVLAWLAGRSLRQARPGLLPAVGQWAYEGLSGLSASIIPHNGARWAPIIGSFFLFILTMNLLGLIPGFVSPTARLNTTGALGLLAILSAQAVGLKVHGVRYFLRFIPGMQGIPWWLAPLLFLILFPLHLLQEFIRPLSLAIRLFGNVFGDDTTILQFALLGAGALGLVLDPGSAGVLKQAGGVVGAGLSVAITAVMIAFAIFVALIQALVFSILTGTYILFAIEME